MKTPDTLQKWIRRSSFGLAGVVVAGGIAFLAVSVAHDLRQLESARSDNVQWTLSQTEVEFLEFSKQLSGAASGPTHDLENMRRRFDVFYSRIDTLESASVYRVLQADDAYMTALRTTRAFLDATAPLIDAADTVLRPALADILANADTVRPSVRTLANSSLDFFAVAGDQRRQNFAETLMKLAAFVGLLVVALGFTIHYLRRLNHQKSSQQRETAETAARMDTVIQTSLDGVIVADEKGNILAFNAAAETIFGYYAEDVLGKPLGPLIVPDHLTAAHEAGMERMQSHGEKRVVGKGRVKMDAKHSDGSIFPVELALQSAETEQGAIYIAFLRDISARVAAEEELIAARDQALAADRLKTEFLATMSHEIRTPLNGLLGNLSLIQDTKLNPQQLRYIANMETSGKLLLQHVSNVLDLSRYDVRDLKLREIPVNLAALIQSIVDSQSGMAASNNTTIEWDWIGPPSNWVLSDPDALQQVLLNLVGNATKFTRDGCVSITVRARGSEFVFEVNDTGQGMDADLKSRIFDDFVTGTVAYDRKVGGTGLGLGIVRRSVRALGGQIEVESTPDKGSTFTVNIRLRTTAPVIEPAPLAADQEMVTGLHILIVEDNEINRMVAREMLQADGHITTEVHDGAAAVELASRSRFDLILMDISMPVMDGRTATRAIRNGKGLCARTPILAVTANAMASEQAAFLQDGMNGVLMKPLSRRALRDEIQALVETIMMGHAADAKPTHLGEIRDVLGAFAFNTMKSAFVTEAAELHRFLDQPNVPALPEVAARCHKTAGSAAMFGMDAYRNTLMTIEDAAKANDMATVTSGIASLAAVWRKTENDL